MWSAMPEANGMISGTGAVVSTTGKKRRPVKSFIPGVLAPPTASTILKSRRWMPSCRNRKREFLPQRNPHRLRFLSRPAAGSATRCLARALYRTYPRRTSPSSLQARSRSWTCKPVPPTICCRKYSRAIADSLDLAYNEIKYLLCMNRFRVDEPRLSALFCVFGSISGK